MIALTWVPMSACFICAGCANERRCAGSRGAQRAASRATTLPCADLKQRVRTPADRFLNSLACWVAQVPSSFLHPSHAAVPMAHSSADGDNFAAATARLQRVSWASVGHLVLLTAQGVWGGCCRRATHWQPHREVVTEVAVAAPLLYPPVPAHRGARDLRFLFAGAALALAAHTGLQWLGHMPWWQRISRRFIWWHGDAPPHGPYGSYAGAGPYILAPGLCSWSCAACCTVHVKHAPLSPIGVSASQCIDDQSAGPVSRAIKLQ